MVAFLKLIFACTRAAVSPLLKKLEKKNAEKYPLLFAYIIPLVVSDVIQCLRGLQHSYLSKVDEFCETLQKSSCSQCSKDKTGPRKPGHAWPDPGRFGMRLRNLGFTIFVIV